MFDLLVIGEINPDLIMRGQNVTPEFGQVEKIVDSADLTIGSSSVITACGAARLGLKVAFVGVVGDDAYGRFMLDSMEDRGIDVSHCQINPLLKTGFTVILARPDGDRAMLTFAGSIAALSLDMIDQDLLQQTRHLHVGSYFLLDNLRNNLPQLFAKAQTLGVTTSLDTNWDPREVWDVQDILPHCDLILPNEAELLRLSSCETIEDALIQLSQHGPTIAVKMSGKGGRVQHKEIAVQSRPYPVQIVDTVGAGDSFNAGFLFGLIRGWSPAMSLNLALACGSLSTLAAGGTAAQPTLNEAMAIMDKEKLTE